jgi:hypothetical protein
MIIMTTERELYANMRVVTWDNNDSPLPKKGEVLTDIFNDEYKVVKVEHGKKESVIHMERL